MRLLEHHVKARFASYGIPVPYGRLVTSGEEVRALAAYTAGSTVLKAQITDANRYELGGVRLARNAAEAEMLAGEMLLTEYNGTRAETLLVEPALSSSAEYCLSARIDRSRRCATLSAWTRAAHYPHAPRRIISDLTVEQINPFLGLRQYQIVNLVSGINLPREHWETFIEIARGLHNCFVESDALLAEINPLVITSHNALVALDGTLLVSHTESSTQPSTGAQAGISGIDFLRLNGNIGCIANGAGMCMILMDMIAQQPGCAPANFCDIGDSVTPDSLQEALLLILQQPYLQSIVISFFGNHTSCDNFVRHFVQVWQTLSIDIPGVVRLNGLNAEGGRALLARAALPTISVAETLENAISLAARLEQEPL